MLGIGEFSPKRCVLDKCQFSPSLSLSLPLSPLPPCLFSDGVEVVVKVFPKHDEKVQLGPYDKRLTGKNKHQCHTCICIYGPPTFDSYQ